MDFVTINEKCQVEIVEKKSKFIGTLLPVENVEEAESLLKEYKKKYHDARHNCYAYRMVENGKILEKSSDDGEPSGTAGAPMLSILKNNGLANVLIIVTRYFGGILLGTGGLVRAYSDSLLEAIKKAKPIRKCEGVQMLATMEYGDFDSFKYYCKNYDISIIKIEYHELIRCKIELEEIKKEKLLQDFETKNVILKNLIEITKKYIQKSI